MEKTVLRDWISHVICYEDGEHHKPDDRVVRPLLEELGIDPTNTLVAGDQWRVDGGLAIALGGQGVIVCRDGDELVGVDEMPEDWQERITVVESLDQVHFEFATIPSQHSSGVWRRARVPSQRPSSGRLQASGA